MIARTSAVQDSALAFLQPLVLAPCQDSPSPCGPPAPGPGVAQSAPVPGVGSPGWAAHTAGLQGDLLWPVLCPAQTQVCF